MDTDQVAANMTTPGAMLRKARESLHLSHIDVAKKLRLKVQWVVDIENNDYKDAAALIYVRGYLRAYARLVKLSPEDVLTAFSELKLDTQFAEEVEEEQFVLHQPILTYSRSSGQKIRRVIWALGGIILLLLVVMVIMWWYDERANTDSQKNETAIQLQTNNQSPEDSPSEDGQSPVI